MPVPHGHFTLLYFASASSFAQKASETFPAPQSVRGLFGELEKRYPGIGAEVLVGCAVTVNLEYVDVDVDVEGAGAGAGAGAVVVIGEGDEVALIPPVSSG
ncbi:MAG: hypothetical protein M1813_006828 [Trichoglossum hirsutum]|nr:MAG: hypothetical protein M1813_006828 [Trichoglossum hirsutum]